MRIYAHLSADANDACAMEDRQKVCSWLFMMICEQINLCHLGYRHQFCFTSRSATDIQVIPDEKPHYKSLKRTHLFVILETMVSCKRMQRKKNYYQHYIAGWNRVIKRMVVGRC